LGYAGDGDAEALGQQHRRPAQVLVHLARFLLLVTLARHLQGMAHGLFHGGLVGALDLERGGVVVLVVGDYPTRHGSFSWFGRTSAKPSWSCRRVRPPDRGARGRAGSAHRAPPADWATADARALPGRPRPRMQMHGSDAWRSPLGDVCPARLEHRPGQEFPPRCERLPGTGIIAPSHPDRKSTRL